MYADVFVYIYVCGRIDVYTFIVNNNATEVCNVVRKK